MLNRRVRHFSVPTKRYFKGLPFKISYNEANKIITQNVSIFEKTDQYLI